MCSTRRRILGLIGGSLLARAFAASLPGTGERNTFDIDRLLSANSRIDSPGVEVRKAEVRKYAANATVTLFSIPLVSKASVGSGYAVVEEWGRTVSIQFGAGSYPDSARGLNRLGFIQEAIIEERPGCPAECAWLAFMTTSQEKNLEQAKNAIDRSGAAPSATHDAMVTYSASQGYGHKGLFTSRVDRLEFPSRYTWRDVTTLVGKAREAMSNGAGEQHEVPAPGAEQPGTFLYMVRRAMLDPRPSATSCLVFNKKRFQLDTHKEPDPSATAYFLAKNRVPPSTGVVRMNAMLTEKTTGEKTPFRLWYQAGAEQVPPLRFEYQAKSFLGLTFEEDD
jgi:hypothetical protein